MHYYCMIKNLSTIIILFLLISLPCISQVSLPRLIRDSMVLQRDSRIMIWGWATPGEKVKVSFNHKIYKAVTEPKGEWNISIEPVKAGGPYTMQIDASNHLVIKDILIGDVWLCSGQSNMVHQMSLHKDRYEQEIATADYPQIRQFWVPLSSNLSGPQEDLLGGYWKTANPHDVLQFSAVAFFFARKLFRRFHIPIGLINASVGGTPIQAWISEDGLKTFPMITSTVILNKDTAYIQTLKRNTHLVQPKDQSEDKGITASLPWYDMNYIPRDWRTITVPGYWETQGLRDFDGIVWYRKEVNIPAAMVGLPAKIVLGRIVNADIVYLNGKKIGQTTYEYPQRRYQLPSGALVAGKNVLVVQVTNESGPGGFVPDKPYSIVSGNDTIDLKGNWEYKVGRVFAPQKSEVEVPFSAQNSPTGLYNAMIAPLKNFAISGFLFYQGESNTENAKEYESLFPSLINDWRNKWGENGLPFLFVQLPNFMDVRYQPSESKWAATRDAQLKALRLSQTGMAVAIDLGEWNDIHPDRKKEIGERLALWAEKLIYHDTTTVVSGPIYQSSRIKGNKLIISFSNIGTGLLTRDGEALSEFAIAGKDKKFAWANAIISGDQVIVWNDTITNPAFVRYAWADNPDNPNLCNKEGLPASPFETAGP